MKAILKRTILTVVLFFPGLALAFTTNPGSGRSLGMGMAGLAELNESATLYTNPAGLGEITSVRGTALYAKPWLGLPGATFWAGDVSAVVPTPYGSAAVGYSVSQADGLKRDQVVALGYGVPVWKGICVGLAAKYLMQEYLIGSDPLAAVDPIFSHGTSTHGFAIDLGGWVPLNPWVSLGAGHSLGMGLAVRNLNQPDLGLGGADKVLLESDFGVVWKSADWGLTGIAELQMQAAGENQGAEPLLPCLGVEKQLSGGTLAVRAGYNPNEITLGFGMKWEKWTLDYAMGLKINLLMDGNYGSHTIGLTYALESQGAGKQSRNDAFSNPSRKSWRR